ncbi:DNA-methyltransferase [Mucisphaera sp.]|uniref:DNA-methyltransferase n=1 Tax=Mucisphaera sp. TaxID=2913024 RepID=UPI003D1318C0
MPKAPSTPPNRQLIQGDCLEVMSSWSAASLDLIFADPPYNIGFDYDGQYHDKLSDEAYLDWTYRWIDGCAHLLKPTGSFYVLIGDEYAAEVRLHLKKLQAAGRLLFRNWIVWHYTFGQRCKLKFNRSHAHLFYAVGSASVNAKGQPLANLGKKRTFTFNGDAIAVPSARQTTYADKRANPRGKLPDDTWYLKRYPDTQHWYTRPQEAVADPEGGYLAADADTWFESRLCGTFKERTGFHPCQLPEALLERIIKVSSDPGDLVFDPFAGSGTTLAVAHRLGRAYLGCEQSSAYAKQARKRIEAAGVEAPKKGAVASV